MNPDEEPNYVAANPNLESNSKPPKASKGRKRGRKLKQKTIENGEKPKKKAKKISADDPKPEEKQKPEEKLPKKQKIFVEI